MLKALLSVGIAASLVCGCVTSVAGKTAGNTSEPPAKSAQPTKTEVRKNEKLRADISRLTADAKAGKISPRSPSPFQPTHRNNLSKGAKIAIVAGIGALIFGIVMWRALNSDDD
jgi:hypothetical protein